MAALRNIVVLVTDISTRKAYDLVNILRTKGIHYIVCDSCSAVEKVMLEKIYSGKRELLRKDRYFHEDMHRIVEKYQNDTLVYIPVEEDTTLLFYEYISTHAPQNLHYNLPKKEVFDIVRDKGAFSSFCHEKGLPVPKEYLLEEVLQMDNPPLPLILKPKHGSGSIGIRYIDTKEALEGLQNLDMSEYILQQRLTNSRDVEGAFFLMHEGKSVTYYGHKRIRTYPVSGGVTVYSKCQINEVLRQSGIQLLQELNWSGIAMVEFIYDEESKTYKIIEVNPRLWGSLMLSEYCGSGMIENYINTACGLPVRDYKIEENRYIRWFFPWDILSWIEQKGKISNFWNFSLKNTCYINFTYGRFTHNMFFLLYNIASPAKLRKLWQKVFAK